MADILSAVVELPLHIAYLLMYPFMSVLQALLDLIERIINVVIRLINLVIDMLNIVFGKLVMLFAMFLPETWVHVIILGASLIAVWVVYSYLKDVEIAGEKV